MTNFKTVLLAATALSMLGGTAMAQSFSNTAQAGDDNQAYIQQSVSGGGSGNAVGAEGLPARQNGDTNVLNVQQFSNSNQGLNSVGASASPDSETVEGATFRGGFEQRGDQNYAIVVQGLDGAPGLHGNNVVGDVLQDSEGSNAATPNFLNVNQLNKGSSVDDVAQRNRGANANTAFITQRGHDATSSGPVNLVRDVEQEASRGSNLLTITQTAPTGGNANSISAVTQFGSGAGANEATISQTGNGNVLAYGRQENTGAGTNDAVVTVTGDDNGTASPFASGTGADSVAIQRDRANEGVYNGYLQVGTDNTLSVSVDGDRNGFAFEQRGNGNIISGGTQGVDSDVAVAQRGDGNIVGYAQVGAANSLGIEIVGSDNEVISTQTGTNQVATVDILGNDNRLLTRQDGGTNGATVFVSGNNNNLPGTAPSFDGSASAALTVAGLGSLEPGFVIQDGFNNDVNLNVFGDSNSFSTVQNGNDNSIFGVVLGNENQAAVAQVSSGNTAVFTQIGTGNNVGVVQGGRF